jgi:hypothetical protein
MNIELFLDQIKEIVSVFDEMTSIKNEITLTFIEDDFYFLLNHFNGSQNRIFRTTNSFNIEIDNINIKIVKNII